MWFIHLTLVAFELQTAIKRNNPKKYLRSVGDGEIVEFDVIQGQKVITIFLVCVVLLVATIELNTVDYNDEYLWWNNVPEHYEMCLVIGVDQEDIVWKLCSFCRDLRQQMLQDLKENLFKEANMLVSLYIYNTISEFSFQTLKWYSIDARWMCSLSPGSIWLPPSTANDSDFVFVS